MTKREQARINRLLAALGHASVIDALQHAMHMQSTLRVFNSWAASQLEMNPDQVIRMTDDALSG